DRWRGEFPVTELGRYVFTIEAWVDHFETWSRQLAKRLAAGQDVRLELEVGARMIEETAARADGTTADSARLRELAKSLRIPNPHPAASPPTSPAGGEVNGELTTLMRRYADRAQATTYAREVEVIVEPEKARFSTWYELFPRSTGPAGRHGTFKDVERLLPEIARMGFDVLYLPPIHPIGHTHRKGANNKPARAGEPGSPWAIGSTSRTSTGGSSGKSSCRSSSSGPSRVSASSGSTTPTPSPSRSGSGSSPSCAEPARTRSCSPRRSPAQGSCTGWPRSVSASP